MSSSQNPPSSLESLLRNLSLAHDEPNHEELLKHANNAVRADKTNAQALHTKVVALLNLDRHEDALRLFEGPSGKFIEDSAIFEKAYALYKLGRLQEALEAVRRGESLGRNIRGYQHIAAQANYRLENFEETARILNHLTGTLSEAPSEENDLRVNTGATYAQAIWAGRRDLVGNKKTPREDLDVFEGAFNAACFSIAKGEFSQGLVLLKRARQLCNELEDLSEEERQSELEPVTLQEIYALSRTGKIQQADELLNCLNPENITDEGLKTIAAINSGAIANRKEDYNPYLAWRNYETARRQATSLMASPFQFQKRLLDLDEMILDLHTGKTQKARNSAAQIPRSALWDGCASVINAASVTANMTPSEQIKKIEAMFKVDPQDIGLALTLVQLRIRVGNVTGAIEALKTLLENLEPSSRYQPGLIGLLVLLYERQGTKERIRNILSEASEWWKTNSSPNPAILRAAGRAKLDSSSTADLTSAGELFASLLQLDSTDKISSAGIVAAYATIDPAQISTYAQSLPSVESLTANINVDDLEAGGVAQPTRKRGAEDMTKASRAAKIRKKKPRLPKDYDPNKKVDPERWLPMRDRSYYKPKGKKDKKRAAATQGGPVTESMDLAGGGTIDVVKVDQVKKQGGGGANKKKKKKGGKW